MNTNKSICYRLYQRMATRQEERIMMGYSTVGSGDLVSGMMCIQTTSFLLSMERVLWAHILLQTKMRCGFLFWKRRLQSKFARTWSLEKTEGTSNTWKSRDIGNIGHKTQHEYKQSIKTMTQKNTTMSNTDSPSPIKREDEPNCSLGLTSFCAI